MKDKKPDLKLMPEKKFGDLVTAITRVPKATAVKPPAKRKPRGKSKAKYPTRKRG
jgi:hypothetical protein